MDNRISGQGHAGLPAQNIGHADAGQASMPNPDGPTVARESRPRATASAPVQAAQQRRALGPLAPHARANPPASVARAPLPAGAPAGVPAGPPSAARLQAEADLADIRQENADLRNRIAARRVVLRILEAEVRETQAQTQTLASAQRRVQAQMQVQELALSLEQPQAIIRNIMN